MKKNNKIAKIIYCLLLLLVPWNFGYAANTKLDSLKKVIEFSNHDTIKIKAMQELAWELKYSQPDTAEIIAQGALKLLGVDNLNDILPSSKFYSSRVSDILNTLGAISYVKSDHPRALEFYFTSLRINEELGNKAGMASSLGNIGVIYKSQLDYKRALEYYLKAAKLLEALGNKKSMATTYNNIGSIYLNQFDYIRALDFYFKSLKIKEEIGSKQGLAHSYTNLGELYSNLYTADDSIKIELGNWAIKNPKLLLDTSFYYHSKAIELCKELDIKFGLVFNYTGLGQVYAQKEDFSQAIKYYELAVQLANSIGAIKEEAISHKEIAEVYKKWAFQLNSPQTLAKENDYLKKSIDHLEKHQQLQGSLFNKESTKQLAEMQTKYETEKKEKEIVLLKNEKDIQELKLNRNKIITISFSIGFVLTLILTIAIFRGYKKKQVINELLEKRKEYFKKQNQEKTAMMKEIHHRVKNNLQVVNSLLRLQSNEVEDEKIVSMFEECQNRVLSMALLHEKMYRSDDLKHIDIQDHFTLLIKELVKDYEVGIQVHLDILIDIDKVDIGIKTLVPLGLIINEIITNSLKYAFKDRNEGTIIVHLKQIEGIKHELIIGDDGIGLKQDEKSTGLGAELIQIFTEQLEGTIERLDVPGTQFKIVFEKIDKG